RQDDLCRAAEEGLVVAVEQRVDQIEAGHERWRRRERVEAADRLGRDADQVVEKIDQQQAGDEGGQRDAERADDAAGMVDEGTWPERCGYAKRDGEGDRQQEGENRQL